MEESYGLVSLFLVYCSEKPIFFLATPTPRTGRSAFARLGGLLSFLGLSLLFTVVSGLEHARMRGSLSDSESVRISVQITQASGSGMTINLRAKPEKRVPSTDNDSTRLTVEIRSVGSTSPLYSTTVTTSSGGSFSGLVLTSLEPGTYDITAKGYSHLRLKKSGVALSTGVVIDFTNAGTNPLLSGDVNSGSGDNKVNGIDLTQLVGELTGSDVRMDLNRDGRVNGIDLTNAVSNLNVVGDS